MNGFLLDTNVPSELPKPFPSPAVEDWLRQQPSERLFLSVVTVGELRSGILQTPEGRKRRHFQLWTQSILDRFEGRILPVTMAVADRWGYVTATRRLAGRSIGFGDGLIAATALEHELTLVTRNVRDFAGLGLELINPWEAKYP